MFVLFICFSSNAAIGQRYTKTKSKKKEFKLFNKDKRKSKRKNRSPRSSSRKSKKNSNAKVILRKAENYIGYKYKYGGESPSNGFDCSGLTQFVFQQSGYKLPRTAHLQSQVGKKVSLNNVKKGDLLFFGRGSKISHVGIVHSNDQKGLVMIHASSSEGVTRTNINQSKYWQKRIKKARRIL